MDSKLPHFLHFQSAFLVLTIYSPFSFAPLFHLFSDTVIKTGCMCGAGEGDDGGKVRFIRRVSSDESGLFGASLAIILILFDVLGVALVFRIAE